MERFIRNAAKALIIKDGKMLAVKINDGKEEWYIMPGGGQKSEELLTEAVCREVAEESGIQVRVRDLVFVVEDIATLNHAPLYPSKLRRQIMNLYEGKAYKVYLGNEEIGDSEITD